MELKEFAILLEIRRGPTHHPRKEEREGGKGGREEGGGEGGREGQRSEPA